MSCSSAIPKYCIDQGSLDPAALRVVITPSNVVPDLTLVTAVELSVVDRRASPPAPGTWTTTILEQTAEELVVEHRYEEADTDTPRTWRIVAWMTVSGAANRVAAKPTFDLQVIARP